MKITRLFVFLLISLAFPLSVWANGQVSGFVRNEQGRGLASITVTLAGPEQAHVLLTDAFGRYRFSALSSGDYQLSYTDENFINDIDGDPYPDEGTVYLDSERAKQVEMVRITETGCELVARFSFESELSG